MALVVDGRGVSRKGYDGVGINIFNIFDAMRNELPPFMGRGWWSDTMVSRSSKGTQVQDKHVCDDSLFGTMIAK